MNAQVTRRALLGATAVIGAGMLPAIALDLPTDRVLIAAAAALEVLRTRERQAWRDLAEDMPDDSPASLAASSLSDAVRVDGETLAGIPAMTPAGLAAKASAMLALVGPGDWAEHEAFVEHHQLVAAVLRDAARLGTAGAIHA